MKSEEEIKHRIDVFKNTIERTTGRVDYEETKKRAILRQKIKLLEWVLDYDRS